MNGRLSNRIAIITGSGRGIGRAIARKFVVEGAGVIIVDIDPQPGNEVCAEIKRSGGSAVYCHADVSKWSDMESMAALAIERFGRVDILVNSAAVFSRVPLEEMQEKVWDRDHSVNLKGSFLAIKSCLPHMKRNRYGRIILISSITGPITALPGYGHYAASKAGMLGLMRTGAIEFAKYGITINAVLPGTIRTEALISGLDQSAIHRIVGCIPAGRLGEPEDIANAALFLASDESEYINGHAIVVDGGQTLPESIRALD